MDEALTKPRNVTHTLYKLYNWMQMGMIDLNPEFQRGMLAAIQKPIVIFLLCIA